MDSGKEKARIQAGSSPAVNASKAAVVGWRRIDNRHGCRCQEREQKTWQHIVACRAKRTDCRRETRDCVEKAIRRVMTVNNKTRSKPRPQH